MGSHDQFTLSEKKCVITPSEKCVEAPVRHYIDALKQLACMSWWFRTSANVCKKNPKQNTGAPSECSSEGIKMTRSDRNMDFKVDFS